MKIILAGTGISVGDLSVRALEAATKDRTVIVKTALTENGKYLLGKFPEAVTLDDVYRRSRNFDTLNKNLADAVVALAREKEVVYYVDGNPADDVSCRLLVQKKKVSEIIPSVSKAAACLSALGIGGKYSAVSAYELGERMKLTLPLVVFDVDSPYLAGRTKLVLSDAFGDEIPCYKFFRGGFKKIKLYESDYGDEFDYSSCLVIDELKLTEKTRFDVDDLFRIVEILRSENGCPWDRAQTKESIRVNTIEEAYELVDAVTRNDEEGTCEEIGDVMLQAVFQTIFAEERNAFTRGDALSGICAKLISRHTHIFGIDHASDESSALDIWTNNKIKEKGYDSAADYVDAVPRNLPALMRFEKCMNRAKKFGFEFENEEQIFGKIAEETEEVRKEILSGDREKLKKECGDLIACAANLTRFLGVECEEALTLATEKTVRRFCEAEKLCREDGRELSSLSPEEWNDYYLAAKKAVEGNEV
ncbi:MAG: nucleoside triphosphate pyrophosphohydrolase [Candidatus Borkfalkiaceae bacterium]|nr:nucleoside triphosphate pyrophosphohydrolase [Christensenellaceae bacterium]